MDLTLGRKEIAVVSCRGARHMAQEASGHGPVLLEPTAPVPGPSALVGNGKNQNVVVLRNVKQS
jgi:hypothetical protein